MASKSPMKNKSPMESKFPMTDIEIANSVKLKSIIDIAKELNLSDNEIELYGKYKAKINYENISSEPKGKVVLVTAINPTTAGEGKTTVSIGLNDGLRKIGVNSVLAIREPSLGPVFGLKGGATGGGYAQVAPMEDINLHFTGDFHAITSANNLLSSMIDNYILQGNEIGIDPNKITFNRCLDLNDRALRDITITSKAQGKEFSRNEHFNITAASEVMAILCISRDIEELKYNLGNITIGYTYDNKPVYARDIKANNAMTILLKDAIKPNLVQSLENNPVLIHCGPFANIAHGCNSIIATDLARKLADVVVTEAGFGADLGAEKFLDLKCRKMDISPSCVVLVATIKALKLHGTIESLKQTETEKLIKGLENLKKHILNITKVFNLPCVVALNKYISDTNEEIEIVQNFTRNYQVKTITTNVWEKGGAGAIELANEVMNIVNSNNNKLTYCYDLEDDVKTKVENICTKIYGAVGVIYTPKAEETLKTIYKQKLNKLPIVIAKTQYSLSDDPLLLSPNEPYYITIRDFEVRTGANMIICLAGNMFLMPGLSKNPAATKMDIKNGIITGLF